MTDSKPSKSARKRAQLELQKLGEQLIPLSDAELDAFTLDQRIVDAIRAARSIRSHGALRRQKQLIGKLMRDLDPEPLRAGLTALRADDLAAKRVFATAEKWRDRLLHEHDAIQRTRRSDRPRWISPTDVKTVPWWDSRRDGKTPFP